MEKFYTIIKRPSITEKTFDLIEKENKLVFIVNISANKNQIRKAVEKIHNVKVIKVNTLISSKGEKKAFVKLHPDYSAQDIAIDLGIF
ncbi:MAG: 50S ribosomal protein L23 [Promethearchaeota archaeon]